MRLATLDVPSAHSRCARGRAQNNLENVPADEQHRTCDQVAKLPDIVPSRPGAVAFDNFFHHFRRYRTPRRVASDDWVVAARYFELLHILGCDFLGVLKLSAAVKKAEAPTRDSGTKRDERPVKGGVGRHAHGKRDSPSRC